jgi:hypothetical protein
MRSSNQGTTVTILILLLQALVVPLAYELSTLAFYCFLLGSMSLEEVHRLSWTSDLALIIPFFSLCYLLTGIWVKLIKPKIKSKTR